MTDRVERISQDKNGVAIMVGYPYENLMLKGASSHVESDAFDRPWVVRLSASYPCRVAFGEDPVADETSMPVNVDQPEYFLLPKGFKISVVGATLNVTLIKTS